MNYKVKAGEYLEQIANRYGQHWEKVWNAPENQALAAKRKTPDLLYPGDELFIPEIEQQPVEINTDSKHRFRVNRREREVSLRLIEETGQPVADLEYEIHIDAFETQNGTIGSDGMLTFKTPIQAQSALLKLPAINAEFTLSIGELEPISRLRGVQQRLKNLGYDPGPLDGIYGPRTQRALLRFQQVNDLSLTSQADGETRQKLERLHDGVERSLNPEDESGTPVKVQPKEEGSDTQQALENELPNYEADEQERYDESTS